MYDQYELYMEAVTPGVHRGRTIKHDKDIFETIDDTFAVLDKLHIYCVRLSS